MSSLKFLKDNDVIVLLGEYVLIAYIKKKEKELKKSREFHMKNLESQVMVFINFKPFNLSLIKKVRLGYVTDINKIPHYDIVSIINMAKNESLQKNKEVLWDNYVKKILAECEEIPQSIPVPSTLDSEASTLSWLNEKPKKRIELYEKIVKRI